MAKINYNLRDAQKGVKESKQVKTPLNLVIRWAGNRLVFPTGLSIVPNDWESDPKKGKRFQRAKSSLTSHAEFNSSLVRLEDLTDKVFSRFVNDNNRQPELSELREGLQKAVNPKFEKKLDFLGYFQQFIREAELKTNDKTKKNYSKSTIGIYKTALKHLVEFGKAKKYKIDFATIDLDFYYSYSEYLEKVKKFGLNNRGKQIKVIKTVLNEATERGLNKNLAFKSSRFKVVSEEAENIYLTEQEIQDLFNLDLSSNKRLERVRDLFYIGCNTGLRFSDLSKVGQGSINGNKLTVKTIKTGEQVTIPLRTEIFKILERHEGNFPASISNQKMNDYLKEICPLVPSLNKKIEISKTVDGKQIILKKKKSELVSTHTARRSFATNCYKANVPVFVIMKITGHRTEKSFLKYIKMNSEESAEILEMFLIKKNAEAI